MSEVKPVFLHGMWRSATTYLWNCFRRVENTHCYYEPLHRGMARLTRARIGRPASAHDESIAHNHPDLSRPLYEEYEGLLGGRGVKGARPGFETKDFVLEPDTNAPAMERYIRTLINHAAAQEKTPVLGFNRTNLRLGWLGRRFDAHEIYTDRAPYDLWLSYRKHAAQGNAIFLIAWLRIAEANRAHPLLQPLAEHLPLRTGAELILRKQKRFYESRLPAMTDAQTYRMVFYFWAASALHALSQDVLVFDVNRITEPGYAEDMQQRIAQLTGLPVSFDDIEPNPSAALEDETLRAVEAEVLEQLAPLMTTPLFDKDKIRSRLTALHPDKAAILARAL